MSLTLNDLLQDLEKRASDQTEETAAEKRKRVEEEAEAKEDRASGKLKSAEKDLEDAKNMEDRVKEAHLQGSALAQEIMQKVASANLPKQKKETSTMNKSAHFAGKALAQSLLTKLASAGDETTEDGIFAGQMPNKAQIDNAQMVAQHDAMIDPTPTADARGDNGGSVNQIFDAIIAKAMAQGATSADQVHGTGMAALEGVIQNRVSASPGSEAADDEVEKIAAVNSLMNSGFDMFEAVDMVKAAEQEILAEEFQQIKQAAMADLMARGVDFELAAAMVKQASVPSFLKPKGAMVGGKFVPKGALDSAKAVGLRGYNVASEYAPMIAEDARGFGQGIRQAVHGKDAAGKEVGRLGALRRAATDSYTGRAVLGAGAVAGAGGAGYALAREKQAALNGLLDAGIDFDSAAQMVSETSQELYGA